MVLPLTIVAEWGRAGFTNTWMLLNLYAYSSRLPSNVNAILHDYMMTEHEAGPLCYDDSGHLVVLFLQTIGRVEQRDTFQWIW
jgi:hypothetical protein